MTVYIIAGLAAWFALNVLVVSGWVVLSGLTGREAPTPEISATQPASPVPSI